jgi:hypothetical protein
MPITSAALNNTPFVITPTPVNITTTAGFHHVHDPADRKTDQYGMLVEATRWLVVP